MIKKVLKNILIYFISIICLLPMIIMIINSFTDYNGGFSLIQYGKVLFQTEDFFRGFWNSAIYIFIIIGINIPLSLLGAYGFSRFEFKGKGFLYWLYIVLMLMPFQATMVPQYLTLKALNIIDSPSAVILPNIFSTFGTFLMVQYMRRMDKEIYDAGRIDGLSEFKLFLKIVMPLCRSIISALTVLLFVNYWSMVEQPLVFISDKYYMPLSVTLNATGEFREISFAAGTVFSILPLLLYQFSYEDLTQGISLSSRLEGYEKIYINEVKERRTQKQKLGRGIIIFMAAMLSFTLITQKISYIMAPEIEVTKTKRGEITKDPFDKKSESLGIYDTIVPNSAIHTEGENVIYVIIEEKSIRKRDQLVRINVKIEATNGYETAITGVLPYNSEVVKWTTKPLREGMNVRVVEGRGEENEE
ncbi:carbohydrate ABC transporter permease [Sporanaerobacter sp. PP17-6a]|uniref:carbohydrate ABC transporter permease n=1 Tax=Sporanaerobacter sp. PP17-6a TaxID=1891289 RepID=UPI0008A03D32|nr:carbohydrate ABC transporter permease [Sporanaerobacter sp. PP17-6a]SCL96166.1 L-arabinose transport system permease protein AraQ [Sporanaerobacter sp. PP17-6a]